MPEPQPNTHLYRINSESPFAPLNRSVLDADIEAIVDPSSYLIKEHFEDFRSRFTDASKQLSGRVFNRLIDDVHVPYVRHTAVIGQNPKPYPGLEVISREEAGIEPYPFKASTTDYRCLRLASFAIRSGSLVSIEQTIMNSQESELFQIFTLSLIDKLKSQLNR